MKATIFTFCVLVGTTSFVSCTKDKAVNNCTIISETDTAISGLSLGSNYSIDYRYDNKGRLIYQTNANYTYGNGFVTFPDPFMGPPDTTYLNANGYPSHAGDVTYIYDSGNHLIKEVVGTGYYFLYIWQNGDNISKVGYYANGTPTGYIISYTYYDNIPFQLTKPNYLYLGVPSSHMLESYKQNNGLGNYTYTYSFDNNGRVSGYKLYDIDSVFYSSKIDTDVWVTHLVYSCSN